MASPSPKVVQFRTRRAPSLEPHVLGAFEAPSAKIFEPHVQRRHSATLVAAAMREITAQAIKRRVREIAATELAAQIRDNPIVIATCYDDAGDRIHVWVDAWDNDAIHAINLAIVRLEDSFPVPFEASIRVAQSGCAPSMDCVIPSNRARRADT